MPKKEKPSNPLEKKENPKTGQPHQEKTSNFKIPARKHGGRKLTHDLRLRLFSEVLELREKGYSYSEIIREVKRRHGVKLSKSHISCWVRRLHSPENEPWNKPNLTPSPELAIIAAASAGDGALKEDKDGAKFTIEMKDPEPIQLISQCLAKIMNREKPYYVGKRNDGRHYTEVQSRELYNHLKKWENITQLLHQHPRDFIKMFFECEGGPYASITREGRLQIGVTATNTNLELLQLLKDKLAEFGISSSIHLRHRAGKVVISAWGRKAMTRKDCYVLSVRQKESIKRYAEEIGFISKRKHERLTDIIEIREKYGSGREAAIEWLRRYCYRKHGKVKWMKRKQPITREEAEAELQTLIRQRKLQPPFS